MGPPPGSHEFALEEDRAVSRGEILRKLDLKGDRPRILGVSDQEIYACVFRGNPHVPFRVVLLYVRSDEVLTSVNCE